MLLPNKSLPWPISWDAVVEIAKSENCKLTAYLCPAGVPTIGWGHTEYVKLGDTCTQERADLWLCEDLVKFTKGVARLLTRVPNSNELGAMVSLAYNIGLGGFERSTVLRKHNEGDYQAAARAFGLWVKIKGTVSNGLTARRAREASLYLTPAEGEGKWAMPQEVESDEQPLKTSRTMAGGVLASAGALAGVIYEAAGPVIKESTEAAQPLLTFAGDSTKFIILGIILLGSAFTIYARVDDWLNKQR